MSQLNNIHWTNDEDLLDRFVLTRLEAEEREKLDGHLRECAQCQQVVRAEQQLVAGVRRAGRDALKARLRERVGIQPVRRINWYQVAGVAATIVFLVTIGIYNRWFFSGETKEAVITEQVDKELRQPAGELKRAEQDEAAVTVQKQKELSAVSKSVPTTTGAATTPREEARRDVVAEPSKAPVAIEKEKGKDVQAEHLQVAAGAQAKKEAYVLDQSTSEANAVWIEGAILTEELKEPSAPHLLAPRGAKPTEQTRARKLDEKISKDERPQMAIQAAEPEPFIVTQRPLSALPQLQRAKQNGITTIQTLVERKEGVLQMTLYLDPLVNESVRQSARIESITEDSIIVNIGSQRIGYKLPPGWAEQALRQAKQKK